MNTKIFKYIAILLIWAGCSYSCEKSPDVTKNVTGTVIGSYYNGWLALLVQVDKKYPIGKAIVGTKGNCTQIPKDGTYQNVIQVQPSLPLSDWPENETIINKKISFSYRPYGGVDSEDNTLFLTGSPGNALCGPLDVPIYIITDCQIIK